VYKRQVPYATGFAYGLVLQVIEMSVGVGVGLIFLAREGLSFASLRRIEEVEEERLEQLSSEPGAGSEAAADELEAAGPAELPAGSRRR
jgi:hypothetical protein